MTKTDREYIAHESEVDENKRYQAISRVRDRFDELERDVEVLEEHHPELLQELRGVVCERHAENPLNVIDRVEGVQAIIDDCVVCGETHHHGHAWNIDFLEGGVQQERSAHCGGDQTAAYDIMIDETTALPDNIIERAKAKQSDPDE